MPTLCDLRPGQRADILAIAGEPPLVQRLSEFGLFEGEQIELVAFAPLGDPLEIRIGDTRLSLRLREARCVTVEPLP
jgi:ferrous iron transport protein A